MDRLRARAEYLALLGVIPLVIGAWLLRSLFGREDGR